MDHFKLRLNCIDHYQAEPTRYDPLLRNDVRASQTSKEPRVPVIRVFGSTEEGQKVCAHIHGAFPYLFVEYRGPLDKSAVGEYICCLHSSIDRALAISYRRDASREQPRFVARVTLVKGVPFYGFHVGYRFYLKIYMLNPAVMTRLTDLLQQGLIMNQRFQPYEAHLQYLLQFMVDYNLYGCDYIKTNKVMFRAPVPEHDYMSSDCDAPHMWDDKSIPSNSITSDPSLRRLSHCSLEVDVCVRDILNRRAVKERRLHHDFVELGHPLPPDMKLVPSMAGLWKDETKRRKRRMGNPNPGSSIFPPDALVSMSADPRRADVPGWIHEDEYREEIQRLIEDEQATMEGPRLTFSDYVKPDPFTDSVKTVLESVEDLFPENLLPALGLEESFLEVHPEAVDRFEVDERGICVLQVDSGDGDFLDGDERVAQKQIRAPRPASGVNRQIRGRDPGPHDLKFKRKPEPEQSKPRALYGFTAGFATSGLRTGKRPSLPVDTELIAEARSQWLLTKPKALWQTEQKTNEQTAMQGQRLEPIPGGDQDTSNEDLRTQHDTNERITTKRPRSALEDENTAPSKRSRTNVLGQADRPSTENIEAPAESSQLTRQQDKPDTPKLAKSSQSTISTSKGMVIKQQATKQSLGFPVVKDSQNSNTRLRLSQQSNSQASQNSPIKKVSFDPLQSVREIPRSPKTSAILATPATPGTPATPSSAAFPDTPKSPGFSTPRLYWDGPSTMFLFNRAPPSVTEVRSTMKEHGLPDAIYQDAYYSRDKDIPARPREYAGREFRLGGGSVPYLPEFDGTGQSPATFGIKPGHPNMAKLEAGFVTQRNACTLRSWEIADPPPGFDEVSRWWAKKQTGKKSHSATSSSQQESQCQASKRPFLSQIVGVTPKSKRDFRYSQRKKSTSVQHEAQYMSTMSAEVHVNTRGKLVPNPEENEVQCIFWCVKSDEDSLLSSSQSSNRMLSGLVVLSEDGTLAKRIRSELSGQGVEVAEEATELDVMIRMVEIVRTHDPDILAGYEVHGSSWGFLIERARLKYDYNLCDEFSRMKTDSHSRFGREADRWGFNTTSTISVTGRHVINIWRAMRGELSLLQYTMENVVWHLLHRRVPHYSWQVLTDWYLNGGPQGLAKALRYYMARTRLDIEILEANELVPRTSEQARLLGVDFFSVFSRGSQFKVESIMFRIAKPENFLLVSPSRKQVGGQNALECLPLVMEPQSAFYTSPVVVLDFQSLYPSVMIAYNYCYSTFLGRIVNWKGTNKMGFTEFRRREGLLSLLREHINVAPNGVMYTKAEVRKSLLAKMLTEILETRVMVKSGMKQDRHDKALQQLLNNRQLALKLLANVTYGYTSASFSGRMPCSEIADSIVQTGRETLERAIAYIHSVDRWGAEVVYGDTDSLFIHLAGRTREQAFDIGAEIARDITDMNPRPVKLKFEKVYQPCVLLAKKRYVGYKFESRDQTTPEFDAKGIETVRRDGTPAEQKMEEKALRILFDTADLSQVKAYLQAQWAKIMRGQVSVQDFCFAREVKLGSYSATSKGPPPPGALISAKRMASDARSEPQYGERVPYVVVSGAPGARLADRCVAPEDLLNSDDASLDAEYYIGKNIIPPLERIFNLVGAGVRAWYDEMPKVQRIRRVDNMNNKGAAGKRTLEWFLHSASCIVCGVKMRRTATTVRQGHGPGPGGGGGVREPNPICKRCAADATESFVRLQARVNTAERGLADVVKVCQTCAGMAPLDQVPCDSKDCPVFYTRVKLATRLRSEKGLTDAVIRRLTCELPDW